MMKPDPRLIDDVRAASRAMVRELGFMNATLAGTAYSPSAVHALLEIEAGQATTAAQLAQVLELEKSSVSRMVGKLLRAGELTERASEEDARVKQLTLTAKGRRTVRAIHAFGSAQVQRAMAQLSAPQQAGVAQGLADYVRGLQVCRLGSKGAGAEAPSGLLLPPMGEGRDGGSPHSGRRDARLPESPALAPIQLRTGYHPGLIGRIVEMHARFYAREVNFGAFFESRVAAGLAEFVPRLDQPINQIWLAMQADRIVGSIAIDGQDLGHGEAHLRWFILDDDCRGGGVGRQLLAEATAFCDQQGFTSTRLWTFKGLDAARRLYERAGFVLAHEAPGDQWGDTVIEQQFVRAGRKGLD